MLLVLQLNNLLATAGVATGICQIAEFRGAQSDNNIQVAKGVNAVQNISYSTAIASQPMSDGTKMVRVISDADVYLELNGSTASANSMRVVADAIEYFGVEKGQVISCYDGSS